jgi:hypothetical protein
MKSLIWIVLSICLAVLVNGLQIEHETLPRISLCGINPDAVMLDFGKITFGEDYSGIDLILYSDCSLSFDEETNYSVYIDSIDADTEFDIGDIQINSSCKQTDVCNVYLGIDDNQTEIGIVLIGAFHVDTNKFSNNPPNIISKEPTGNMLSDDTILKITTDQYCHCRYDSVAENYNDMSYTFDGNGYQHSSSLNLDDGDYSFNVMCNSSIDILSVLKKIEFGVNAAPPIVYEFFPSDYSDDWNEIVKITTDNAQSCYYSYDRDNGTEMAMTRKSDSLHEFFYDTDYQKAYVRCKNEFEMFSELYEIKITEEESNEATIVMDNENQVNSGVIEIEMILKKSVTNPKLYYRLVEVGKTYSVPLEGRDRNWKGIIHIQPKTQKQIGDFDLYNSDRELISIIKGKYFVVDSTRPTTVKTVTIDQVGKYVQLKWKMPNDDISYYKLYRTVDEDYVDEFDFYKNTNDTRFVDTHVTQGPRYYYRIAAVDFHDNLGFLSNQYSIQLIGEHEETLIEEETETSIIGLSDDELRTLTQLKSKFKAEQKNVNEKSALLNQEILKELGMLNDLAELDEIVDDGILDLEEMLKSKKYDATKITQLNDDLVTIPTKTKSIPSILKIDKSRFVKFNQQDVDLISYQNLFLKLKRLDESKSTLARINHIEDLSTVATVEVQIVKSVVDGETDSFTRLVILPLSKVKDYKLFLNLKSYEESVVSYSNIKSSNLENEDLVLSYDLDGRPIILHVASLSFYDDLENLEAVALDSVLSGKNDNSITGSAISDLVDSKSSSRMILIVVLASVAGVLVATRFIDIKTYIPSLKKNVSTISFGNPGVSDKFYMTVPNNVFLKTIDGRNLYSIHDVYMFLKEADDKSFIHHVNKSKNDFADWIDHCFKLHDLAVQIGTVNDRQQMHKTLKGYFRK